MNREDIIDAITLFRYSETAKRGRGPAVLATLLRLFDAHEIGFHKFKSKTLRGRYKDGRKGYDIQISRDYFAHFSPKHRLAAISLVVVHEATHATDNFDDLYSELAARLLPIYYYRELSGPGVFNEAADPPVPGKPSGIIRLSSTHFSDLTEQSEALRKDQLIDFVLDIETYTTDQYIVPQWIIDNLGNWGGLKNRLPNTKGVYLNVVAASEDYDARFPPLMLTILESVQNQADWDAVTDAIDSMRDLRAALAKGKRDPQVVRRIAALERRWKVDLTLGSPNHSAKH